MTLLPARLLPAAGVVLACVAPSCSRPAPFHRASRSVRSRRTGRLSDVRPDHRAQPRQPRSKRHAGYVERQKEEGDERQVEGRAGRHGLRRPHRGRRPYLRRHEQRQAARPEHHGRQGRDDVLQRGDGTFLWQIVHDKLADSSIDAGDSGVASTPAVDGDRLYYVSNRCELVCADAAGDPTQKGKGKIVWSLDMMKDLKVWPGGIEGGLANCSPLVLGRPGLRRHLQRRGRQHGKAEAPRTPQASWPSTKPTARWPGAATCPAPTSGRPVGQPGRGRGQRRQGSHLPRRRRLAVRLRGQERRAALEVRLQPQEVANSSRKTGTGDAQLHRRTPVVVDGKVYIGVGREPDAGPGVGHLWCIDITKKPESQGRRTCRRSTTISTRKRRRTRIPASSGTSAACTTRRTRSRLAPTATTPSAAPSAPWPSTTAWSTPPNWTASCTASTPRPARNTGSTTWAAPCGPRRIMWTARSTWAWTTATCSSSRPARTDKEPNKIEMGQSMKVPPVAANGVLFVNNGLNLYAIK